MSIESAKLFIKKMDTTVGFGNKVMEIEIAEDFDAFILKEGFDFTGTELKAAKEELNNKQLTDEDLEKVVGGWKTLYQTCQPGSTSSYCKLTYL